MNILTDYIATHDDWENELQGAPYNLFIRASDDFPNLRLFAYNQIKSDMTNPLVKVCRGIIVDISTLEVVCYPFDKFFNYNDPRADKIDWSTARIQEKIDGCLRGDTIVITPDGEYTIQQLCDTQYRGKVLSKNLATNQLEWDTMIAESVKDSADNWYEIELEDGTILNVTGNHKIWLPELQCWREVENLDGDEKVDVHQPFLA